MKNVLNSIINLFDRLVKFVKNKMLGKEIIEFFQKIYILTIYLFEIKKTTVFSVVFLV